MDDLLGAPNGPVGVTAQQDPLSFMAPSRAAEPAPNDDPFAGMGGGAPVSVAPRTNLTGGPASGGPSGVDKLRIWEKNKDEELRLLAEKETKAKEERRRYAQQELEEFYKRRKATIEVYCYIFPI